MPLVKTPGASEVQRRDDGGGRKPLELAFRGGGVVFSGELQGELS